MNCKKKIAVVIPLWKEDIEKFEEISFNQCCIVLKNYTICLVTHRNLRLDKYIQILNRERMHYKIFYFHKNSFDNLGSYNRMMLSVLFYIRFIFFEYILIYQLDCFVFRNELEIWIQSGYSYIGAPWLKGYSSAKYGDPVLGVGNGGFSLRRVKDHLRVLFSLSSVEKTTTSIKKNNTFFLLNNFSSNEDIFWGNIAAKNFFWFKVPDWRIAAQFSIEVQPKFFFELSQKIPFGCHAWWRYDIDFWRPYIEEFGYNLGVTQLK